MFLRYNSMGTWDLVKHYGFCVPDNPSDSYPVTLGLEAPSVTLKDSVFEIAKARLYAEHELFRSVLLCDHTWVFPARRQACGYRGQPPTAGTRSQFWLGLGGSCGAFQKSKHPPALPCRWPAIWKWVAKGA